MIWNTARPRIAICLTQTVSDLFQVKDGLPEWVQESFKIVWPDSTSIDMSFPGNLRYSAIPKRDCSKRRWTQKHAKERKSVQKSANAIPQKSTNPSPQKGAIERKIALARKIANNQV